MVNISGLIPKVILLQKKVEEQDKIILKLSEENMIIKAKLSVYDQKVDDKAMLKEFKRVDGLSPLFKSMAKKR